MLDHRRRLWFNITTTLRKILVQFAGYLTSIYRDRENRVGGGGKYQVICNICNVTIYLVFNPFDFISR